MASRCESASARARGKCPMEPKTKTQSAHVRKGRQKARADMDMFGSPAEHERYRSDFHQWKVISRRDTLHSRGPALRLFSPLWGGSHLSLFVTARAPIPDPTQPNPEAKPDPGRGPLFESISFFFC